MQRPKFLSGGSRRASSFLHYHTFPVRPPTSRGRPPFTASSSVVDDDGQSTGQHGSSPSGQHQASPLPKKQLAVLAVIALAEQTALNSISPYLPEMASTFPEVDPSQVGLYVGLIASAFALAQFVTGFFWGWLSDHIGRKPIIVIGTFLTAACFVAFGFCRTLWQAVLVQAIMGLVNGNQGLVAACLGEITDRSNQSEAFTYLPVIYGLGGITGPMVGGLLVSQRDGSTHQLGRYPFLLPNLFSAAVLILDLVVSMIWLEESLEEAKTMPPLGKRISGLFSHLWRRVGLKWPSYLRWNSADPKGQPQSDEIERADYGYDNPQVEHTEDSGHVPSSSLPALFPHQAVELERKDVFNKDTILLMASYLIFQLSNVTFNSLYPVFASAPPPTGRNLSPRVIGVSLAFAGIVAILFQVGVFARLRDALGNKATYRISFAIFTLAFALMPWVGYEDSAGPVGLGHGRLWLWLEIGFVLLLKTIASVGGLTSSLLLITNSAPNHSVLGTLNGLAQTLSAAGRAAGPFISGGLFSISTHVRPMGEALAWGVFGGVALVGFFISFGITNPQLEADGWDEDEESIVGQGNDDDGWRSSDAHENDVLLPAESRRATK